MLNIYLVQSNYTSGDLPLNLFISISLVVKGILLFRLLVRSISFLLDEAQSPSLFPPSLLHFINHHELKLRQIYQLANGGPVPACTPLHT